MYHKITGIIATGYGAIAAFGWLITPGADTLTLLLTFLLISVGISSFKYGRTQDK